MLYLMNCVMNIPVIYFLFFPQFNNMTNTSPDDSFLWCLLSFKERKSGWIQGSTNWRIHETWKSRPASFPGCLILMLCHCPSHNVSFGVWIRCNIQSKSIHAAIRHSEQLHNATQFTRWRSSKRVGIQGCGSHSRSLHPMWKPTSVFLCQNFQILPSFSCLSQRHHEFRLFSRFHWLAQAKHCCDRFFNWSEGEMSIAHQICCWSVDSQICKPFAPPPQQNNDHLFHCCPLPPFCSTLPTRSLLTLLSLSPSPLTRGCFKWHSAGAGSVSGCHNGLLGAVMGGLAGQYTTAATDPLCWWWYLRVINLGTLCKLHREAEN